MSSPDLLRYKQAYLAAEDASKSPIPADLALLIEQGQTTLHQLVKALGPDVLVSDDDKVRGKGVLLLALVLAKLPKERASRQEVRTLTDFFCSESTLAAETLLEALEGLIALAPCTNFGIGDTIQVCKALFENVQMRSHVQSTRFKVFVLIDLFMAHQRRALKRMGDEFLAGYCNLASGEKDPRNLRLAFSIVKVILIEFDIASKVEDLFDITFCYFPITFTPPPGDPYGISSEELQANLREALVSTPRFGPLAVPLVLDKLQASSQSAKRQSLQVFADAFPIYGKAVCEEHSKLLWEALLLEVYHATNAEFEMLSFAALKSLLATLYPDNEEPVAKEELMAVDGEEETESEGHVHAVEAPASSLPPVKGIAVDICDHCLSELQEADKSNAKAATKVLATMINVSLRLAVYLLPRVLEQMLKRYRDAEQRSQRPAVLAVIGALLAAVRHRPPPYPAVLTPFGDELLSVLSSALKPSATRGQALAAIVQLAQIPQFLAQTELVFIVQNLISLVVDEELEAREASVDDALEGIAAVAKLHPQVVDQHALPPLVAELPDSGPIDPAAVTKLRGTLSSLAKVCTQPDLFEALSLRLTSRIERAAAVSPATEPDLLFVHLMLTTLRLVLERKIEAGDTDLPKYIDRLVPNLFRIFLAPALKEMGEDSVASDPRLLSDAGKVMSVVVQSLDEKQQTAFATRLRQAYHDGDLKALLDQRNAPDVPFKPLEVDAPTHQANTYILFAACMTPMRGVVSIAGADLSDSLARRAEAASRWSESALFLSCVRVLATTVNKHSPDVSNFLDKMLPAFWAERVEADTQPLDERIRALQAVAWIARGLIVRSDNRGYDWLKHILSLFPRDDIGRPAARSLGIIADDSDGLLTKRNFAIVKMLYKQRFFSTVLSQILTGYKASAAPDQPVYLVALAVLLRHVPQTVAKAELPKLMPLLLRALDLPDADLRVNVIDTLTVLAPETAEALTPHASSLVTVLLRNSLDGPVESRLSALRCLGAFPLALPYVSLHAQKPIVIRELTKALDDKKRSIRREAVDARARWFTFSGGDPPSP